MVTEETKNRRVNWLLEIDLIYLLTTPDLVIIFYFSANYDMFCMRLSSCTKLNEEICDKATVEVRVRANSELTRTATICLRAKLFCALRWPHVRT